MRLPLLVAVAALFTTPAAAQPELGERTRAPETMVGELRLSPGDDDLAQAIAEAETHPLGSQQNPIRVGGPDGERNYLARLRCAGGAAPTIGERSSGGVDAFGTLTRVYPVGCASAAGRVHFDIYHEEHVEDRAPAGFSLLP
jgi:hypothetical protein